jgi:hypothetical protein
VVVGSFVEDAIVLIRDLSFVLEREDSVANSELRQMKALMDSKMGRAYIFQNWMSHHGYGSKHRK